MKGDQFYKCLGNETRLRCVMLLLDREEPVFAISRIPLMFHSR